MTKICLNCGTQIEKENMQFCPSCGKPVGQPKKYDSGLLTAAYILMIISCVGIGWLLIPLAWLIPMTCKIRKRQKGGEKLSTGFKVCTLIFANLIVGILLLCDEEA